MTDRERKQALLHRLRGTYLVDEQDRVLLHGYLRIQIIRGEGLRNMDGLRGWACHNTKCTRATPVVGDLSDPYVTVHAGTVRLCKTSTKWNQLNPEWRQEFVVPVAHYIHHLEFRVKDSDFNLTTELLGVVHLPVQDLIRLQPPKPDSDNNNKLHHHHPQLLRTAVHRTVALDAKPRHGWLEYAVEFVPVDYCIDDFHKAVPGTYFEPRWNGHAVRLYINSDDKTENNNGSDHTPYNNNPQPMLSSSSSCWQPHRLWRDIYDSLCAAEKLIYIVGWSVDHRQSLLRGEEQQEALQNYKNNIAGAYSPYLGELLKQKSAEGVRVNILVWDDRTSNTWLLGLMKEGVMNTSDEALRLFFRHTEVNVCLAPIAAKHGNPFVGVRNTFTSTHHQKTIVCDNPNNNNNNNQLVGYVGGVDLTGGRYEDGTYPLFRTLQSDHRDDFYNGCAAAGVNAETGPRQPWHDIHARVTGRVVLDLVQNFEERWQKQAPPDIVDKLVDLDAAGIRVEGDDVDESDEALTRDEDESWSCQLFRSIDDRTAKFDSALKARTPLDIEKTEGIVPVPAPKGHDRVKVDKKTGKEKRRKRDRLLRKDYRAKLERFFVGENAIGFCFDRFLNRKGKVSKDASAQEAMVHHIRRAEHCIYIESQYFLSSSHFWSSDTSVKCGNLVAAETALKICRKIEAGERFAAYILLPMWSEGIPESMTVQSILYWQYRTIESMFKRIAAAIQRRKTWVKKNTVGESFDAKPTDYLNFYCLGQRETKDGSQATAKPAANTQGEVLTQTRRHLIYIHSKMVIVDDAVALIGSANINERSLDGSRDSEIVLGCWQQAHLADKNDIGRGDVHGLRLQCFAHTMGTMDDSFRNPSSLECVQRVNQIAQANWKTYTSDKVTDMRSYLLPYPIAVDGEGGIVTAATEDGCFPDTTAKILGSTTILPEFLTT